MTRSGPINPFDSWFVRYSPVVVAMVMNLYCYSVCMAICVTAISPLYAQIILAALVSVFNGWAIFCYARVIVTEPGRIPEEWRVASVHLITDPQDFCKIIGVNEDSPSLQRTAHTVDSNGARRFCAKCKALKPDRTHHCTMCNSCIVRYDHHCPWVSNCVGYNNHKYFVVFLFYALLTDGFFLGISIPAIVQFAQGTLSPSGLGPAAAVSLAISGVMLPSIGGLWVTHMILMVQNKTTVEMHFPPRFTTPTARPNGFDIGKTSNWQSMMGPHLIAWLLPFQFGERGDGTEFPVCHQSTENV